MSYPNPLHPPVRSSNYSHYSTLDGAFVSSSPTRRRVPLIPYTPSSKRPPAAGHIHSPIHFDYAGYSKQGVSMCELSARSGTALSSMIQGANDAVFGQVGLTRIAFRIIWPGYEHVDWVQSVDLLVGGHSPITRAQLGSTIAQSFARFVEKTRLERSTSSEWSISPSGIRFDHLLLVALVNTFGDVWQADIAVDLR